MPIMQDKILVLVLSLLLLTQEASLFGKTVDVKVMTNEVTGEVLTSRKKKNINPLNVVASIYSLSYLFLLEKKKKKKEEGYSPEKEAKKKGVPETQISYKQRKRKVEDKRDIFQTVADFDKSLLVPAITGSGKTTLLKGAIKKVIKEEEGRVNFLVLDPKNSKWDFIPNNTFEDGHESVVHLDKNNMDEFYHRLQWVADDYLKARGEKRNSLPDGQYNPSKTVIIVDEFLALQTKAKRSLKAGKVSDVNQLISEIIIMGREDRVVVWLVAQTHQCTKIGLSDGLRSNLGIIGLASPDKTDSVEAMAKDHLLFKSEEDRAFLEKRIKDLKGEYFYVSNLKTEIECKKTPYNP